MGTCPRPGLPPEVAVPFRASASFMTSWVFLVAQLGFSRFGGPGSRSRLYSAPLSVTGPLPLPAIGSSSGTHLPRPSPSSVTTLLPSHLGPSLAGLPPSPCVSQNSGHLARRKRASVDT